MSSVTQMLLFGSAAPVPILPPTTFRALPPSPNSPSVAGGQPSLHPEKTARQQAVAGTCRFCGCAGNHIHDATGDRCEWTDPSRTACDAEACRNKLAKESPAPVVRQSAPKRAAKKSPKKSSIFTRTTSGCSCGVCSGRSSGRCRRFYGGR